MKRSLKKQPAPNITTPQREVLIAMASNPTKSLYRWSQRSWSVHIPVFGAFPENVFFNTAAVKALIGKGCVDVSQTENYGSYPVEIRLNHLSYEALKNAN